MTSIRQRTVWLAAAIDILLITLFAAIGRSNHDENPAEALLTAWPFLVGLAVGWLLSRAWRRPLGPVLPGVVLAVTTIAVGMVLRLLTGQGTQAAFVIVATLVVAAFLIGWRTVAYLIIRYRAHRAGG